MSGILGKTNYRTITEVNKFMDSCLLMKSRGPDEQGFMFDKEFSFGHSRLAIIDLENGKQPMGRGHEYLIYNGEIYNTEDLVKQLSNDGIIVDSKGDTKVLYTCLQKYGITCVNILNGIFAFAFYKDGKLYAARDAVGAKPLYYTIFNGDIIISSEIKAILNYTGEAIVDENGLRELLGMAPSHSLGKTIYKGIYELEPGCYLEYSRDGLKITKYFELVPKEFTKTKEETIKDIRSMCEKAIKMQLISDVGISSLLSGGLDSSIIALIAGKQIRKLDTYSVDYERNKDGYKTNSFETSDDQNFIKYAVDMGNFNHSNCIIDSKSLLENLNSAVDAKDYPGMTDIDAALICAANFISKKHKVSLSGECADELFGGYPWYYRKDEYQSDFPWIRNLDDRENLINKSLKPILNIKQYVKEKYNEAIEEVKYLEGESEERIKDRLLYYLNVKYFMLTLLDRNDRMTMKESVEVRAPFADKEIVSYLYNVPFEYKYYNNTEKALLRDAFKDILPEEIYSRKKSPFPKCKATVYDNLVKDLLQHTLENKDSILYRLFDYDKITELINKEEDLETPWFGQLMRKTQLLAFLYQIDYWYRKYKIKIIINGDEI